MSTGDPSPFDREGAHADLRALGRKLDTQVSQQGAAAPELDDTLAEMKRLHGHILDNLDRPEH
jgi:hypothetical protein